MKYPKVLIVSGFGLDSNAASDITLRSYFAQWPKEQLMILTSSHVYKPFAKTITLKSDLFLKLRISSSKLFLNKKKGIDNRNLVPGAIISNKNNRFGIKQKIFATGAAYRDLFDLMISNEILLELDNFKPEVIYTIMGNRRIIRLAYKMSKRYKVKVVPHFMDDWISTIYTGNLSLMFPRKLLLTSLYQLMKNVDTGLGISKKMCNEYEKRFKKKFIPLMNTVNFDYFSTIEATIRKRKKELSFTYFGGLHLNRWKSLIVLSEILNFLSKKNNYRLKLEIYTKSEDIKKYSSHFLLNNVIFYTSINHEQACVKMKETDFLIHIEAFDKSVIRFTRLSISTKIPEYLASGTPICAIGPRNIASIEYLLENECGYISTSLEHEELMKTITSAISGEDKSKFKKSNFELVNENHSDNQNEKFRELLKNSNNL